MGFDLVKHRVLLYWTVWLIVLAVLGWRLVALEDHSLSLQWWRAYIVGVSIAGGVLLALEARRVKNYLRNNHPEKLREIESESGADSTLKMFFTSQDFGDAGFREQKKEFRRVLVFLVVACGLTSISLFSLVRL